MLLCSSVLLYWKMYCMFMQVSTMNYSVLENDANYIFKTELLLMFFIRMKQRYLLQKRQRCHFILFLNKPLTFIFSSLHFPSGDLLIPGCPSSYRGSAQHHELPQQPPSSVHQEGGRAGGAPHHPRGGGGRGREGGREERRSYCSQEKK